MKKLLANVEETRRVSFGGDGSHQLFEYDPRGVSKKERDLAVPVETMISKGPLAICHQTLAGIQNSIARYIAQLSESLEGLKGARPRSLDDHELVFAEERLARFSSTQLREDLMAEVDEMGGKLKKFLQLTARDVITYEQKVKTKVEARIEEFVFVEKALRSNVQEIKEALAEISRRRAKLLRPKTSPPRMNGSSRPVAAGYVETVEIYRPKSGRTFNRPRRSNSIRPVSAPIGGSIASSKRVGGTGISRPSSGVVINGTGGRLQLPKLKPRPGSASASDLPLLGDRQTLENGALVKKRRKKIAIEGTPLSKVWYKVKDGDYFISGRGETLISLLEEMGYSGIQFSYKLVGMSITEGARKQPFDMTQFLEMVKRGSKVNLVFRNGSREVTLKPSPHKFRLFRP